MSKVYTIAVLVGSLRKESINRKVALALAELAPATLKLNIVEIGDLPLYNEDLEVASPPAAYSSFRQHVRSSDAVLFVTPEYNRSVPAPLKNAIDVGSRPYGQSTWSGKPGAVVSVSPGVIGGFGPTITCGNRWCSSTCPPCSSRKRTWAAWASGSMIRENSSTNPREASSANSSPRTPPGSRASPMQARPETMLRARNAIAALVAFALLALGNRIALAQRIPTAQLVQGTQVGKSMFEPGDTGKGGNGQPVDGI